MADKPRNDDRDEFDDDQDESATDSLDEEESDTDAAADEAGDGSDESDSGDDSDVDAEDGAAKPKKGKPTREDRIAELVKRAKDAEKAAFEAEMKLIEAENRENPAPSAAFAIPAAPKPEDFVYGDVDPAYLEAVVEHRVAKKTAELQAAQQRAAQQTAQQQEQQRLMTRLRSVVAEGSKKYADFKTIVDRLPVDFGITQLILDSDNAVDIIRYMDNNISKLREITRLDAAGRARAIGQLEGRFSAASAARKATKAPEPMGEKRTKALSTADEAKYGPRDQAEFDKAFYS